MTQTHLRSAELVVPAPAVFGQVTHGVRRARLDSIDLLRGIVMVLMALDHTRDFFSASSFNPRDVADPALFMTRWVTHFCAPIFILLSGTSAYLYGQRGGRGVGGVSWYLLTRGFWLIVIQFTVVRFLWSFSFQVNFFVAQVIWVIGASMIVLAGLVYLPRWAMAAIGLTMIAGHNLLDGLGAEQLGRASWVGHLLHEPGLIAVRPHTKLFVLYTLVPWVGVMAVGYALGPLFKLDASSRQRFLLYTGIALTVGFVVLRATNIYGDPAGWSVQSSSLGTLLSFIDCEKYPPSLLFIMMTLGPGLILLAICERVHGPIASRLTTFGRVPFLFYLAHIALIHALAVVLAWTMLDNVSWTSSQKPPGYGFNLLGVYAAWFFVVVALYPICDWFAKLKRRRTEWWWSYL